MVYGDPILGDQLDLFKLSFDGVDDLKNLQAPDFILAKLSFDAIGAGTSSLTFSGVTLGDANGDPLTADLGTGSVTVESAVSAAVPEPSSIILVALGLLMLAWSRGRWFQCDG